MNTDLTELVFILDRSGSMSPRVADVIGGFNGLIEKQRKEPGAANVTLWLENASVEFDEKAIAALIEQQRTKYNWEVIYIGANQDAQKVAAKMAIPARAAMTYAVSHAGYAGAFQSLNASVAASRGMMGSPVLFTDDQRKASVADDEEDKK